jgi:hypothetical protein
MNSRRQAHTAPKSLLDLLEKRFDLELDCTSASHLRDVCEHYDAKRGFLLWQHGEAGALACDEYAKAVLISETARLTLREIDPWPRRKKPHKGKSP